MIIKVQVCVQTIFIIKKACPRATTNSNYKCNSDTWCGLDLQTASKSDGGLLSHYLKFGLLQPYYYYIVYCDIYQG